MAETRPEITIGAQTFNDSVWDEALTRSPSDIFRNLARDVGRLAGEDFRTRMAMGYESSPALEPDQESSEESEGEVEVTLDPMDTAGALERAGRRLAELGEARRDLLREDALTVEGHSRAHAGRRLRELGNQDPAEGERTPFTDPVDGPTPPAPYPDGGFIGIGGSSPLFPSSMGQWMQMQRTVEVLRDDVATWPVDTMTEVSINNTDVEVTDVQTTLDIGLRGESMVTVDIKVKMTRQEYDRIMESTNSEQKALDEPKGRKIRA